MPTKHKRKRGEDESHFDLPPTSKARSLPVIEPTKDFITSGKKQKVEHGNPRRKKPKSTDDTPKQFARLMAWHMDGKKIGGGLDNGQQPKKKKKQAPIEQSKTDFDLPKIKPGETLAQYGIRIDQALPLSSLPKTNVNPNTTMPADLIEKEKKAKAMTKHHKRLLRLQTDWRKTEAKLKDKEAEEAEENVEKIEQDKLLWEEVKTTGKKGKKKVVDDDPWRELEKKRRMEEGRKKGSGFALTAKDQVQAPPEFNVKKLNPFKQRHEHGGTSMKVM